MLYSLNHIVEFLEAELVSASGFSGVPEPDLLEESIIGIASLNSAEKGQISFLASAKYAKGLSETNATAVILAEALAESCPVPALIVEDPYLAYAKLTSLFAPSSIGEGIHASAVVAESAVLGSDVSLGPNSYIGENVQIGDSVSIGAGVVIGDRTTIGDGTVLYPNATVYHDIRIGSECIIHSGAVVGSDGFGFAPSPEGYIKIHQLGGVVIGDRVEIGSNASIDRGALVDTEIHDGVKIDNLVHVAHNCVIGENTALAGQAGVAGSTKIGKNCTFGGQVGIVGHVNIGDNVHATGKTRLSKSITKPGIYSSGTGFLEHKEWQKNAVRFNHLDNLYKQVQTLDKKINKED